MLRKVRVRRVRCFRVESKAGQIEEASYKYNSCVPEAVCGPVLVVYQQGGTPSRRSHFC